MNESVCMHDFLGKHYKAIPASFCAVVSAASETLGLDNLGAYSYALQHTLRMRMLDQGDASEHGVQKHSLVKQVCLCTVEYGGKSHSQSLSA